MERQSYTLNIKEIETFAREMTAKPETLHYLNCIYNLLNQMPVNGKIDITKITAGKDEILFIKTVCLYIGEIGRGVQFSSDYQFVIKKDINLFTHKTLNNGTNSRHTN